jgi:hypothetical protein
MFLVVDGIYWIRSGLITFTVPDGMSWGVCKIRRAIQSSLEISVSFVTKGIIELQQNNLIWILQKKVVDEIIKLRREEK